MACASALAVTAAAGASTRSIVLHATEVGACTTGPPQPLGVDGLFSVPQRWGVERFKPDFTTYKCDSAQVLMLPRGIRSNCPVLSAFVDGFRNTPRWTIRRFETAGSARVVRSGPLPKLNGAHGSWATVSSKKLGTTVMGVYEASDGGEFYELLIVPGFPKCDPRSNHTAVTEAEGLARQFRIRYTNAGPRETP